MSTDPFFGARYSIRHAHRRIVEFAREAGAFVKTRPYAHVVDEAGQGGFKSHKIKLTSPMPEALPGIAFDVANNLRSALDQMGYAIATAPAVGKSGRCAHFPFGSDYEEASKNGERVSRDLPADVVYAMLTCCKPYKSGDRFLWAVNRMANTQKHESIVRVTASPGIAMVHSRHYPGIAPAPWPLRWDPVNDEMEIARAPIDSTDKVTFNGQMEIVIGDIEGIAGGPAVETLDRMMKVVEQCVTSIEGVARRLGYIT